MICKVCQAWMLDHKENRLFKKCPTCAFSLKVNGMITLEQYFMGRRELYPKEYNEEIEKNATILLNRVNALLEELGIRSAEVSSGWRPASVNGVTTNAAKMSAHMTGMAIDIKDDKMQTLAKLIESKPELLIKYDLWLEHPDSTKGKYTSWVHLDYKSRAARAIRIFKP